MCGICCIFYSCSKAGNLVSVTNDCLLQQRGPDINSCCHLQGVTADTEAVFAGYTLHFRGQFTKQPLQDSEANILLWNGEIFDGIEVGWDDNDGEVLLHQLAEHGTTEGILQTLARIQGPWGMIYWQANEKKLWFGRDVFGRRSLLWQCMDGRLALSSVRCGDEETAWSELPAYGIYCLELNPALQIRNLSLYPWVYSSCTPGSNVSLDPKKLCPDLHEHLPAPENLSLWRYFNKNLEKLLDTPDGLQVFNNRVLVNATGIQPQFGMFNLTLPSDDIAEACQKTNADDAAAAAKEPPNIEQLYSYAFPEQVAFAEQLVAVLGEAVKVRVTSQSVLCDRCMKTLLKSTTELQSESCGITTTTTEQTDGGQAAGKTALNDKVEIPRHDGSSCGHTRVAVLFSGGIDSLVIAALADRFVPAGEPIDLLNVAFEQKTRDGSDPFGVPDRITGILGLSQLNPQRKWNFVKVNVTLEELQHARQETVGSLVYPLRTVLDDSIGCAIWFAARGQGIIEMADGQIEQYATTARVVLVGMGADEQLVGYTRHRAKFNSEGWPGLMAEIQMEIERISARNLGRDDRVISSNGRESRFPFLDEKVVAFLNALPLWLKANLCLPRGIGEKFLLRLAADQLGLQLSALLPKRAIQFGSRIAKMENRKEKASDTCARLGGGGDG